MSKLDKPAFYSLDLSEFEKAAARYDYLNYGPPNASLLIECIEKNGKIDGVLESARLLPLREYNRVKDIWDNAVEPDRPIRRKKRRK